MVEKNQTAEQQDKHAQPLLSATENAAEHLSECKVTPQEKLKPKVEFLFGEGIKIAEESENPETVLPPPAQGFKDENGWHDA